MAGGFVMTPESVVDELFATLRDVDGWAVMKHWEELPTVRGDIDLIVRPANVDTLVEKTAQLFASLDAMATVFVCNHIPGVPRVFAHLPAHAFGSRLLEVDFATVIPVRGQPLVTYQALAADLEYYERGCWRTSRAAADCLEFVFTALRWTRVKTTKVPHRDALASLVGERYCRVVLRTVGNPATIVGRARLLASSLRLAAGTIRMPRLLISRLRFRARTLSPGKCGVDPSFGRRARVIVSHETLRAHALFPGHIVIKSAHEAAA
jgi:hypothetical protein